MIWKRAPTSIWDICVQSLRPGVYKLQGGSALTLVYVLLT